MRLVLNVEARRTTPWTSYPFARSSSARYEPSCPVMPVMRARFIKQGSYLPAFYPSKGRIVFRPVLFLARSFSAGSVSAPSQAPTIFFLTVCVYITSLVVEYNRGKIDSEECFTNLTHEIATACKTTIPGTPAFSQAMDQAVLNDASIAYIDLKTNDQLLFSYPSDLSSSNQTRSTFIRSYSTSISASDGSLLIFTAALYLLKPSSIFYKGRIAFLIILAATIAAFIYLILLSKSSDNANESIDKKTDDIIASVQDFDTPTNPESKESESTETETADNSFEPESIIPTASDIDTVSNTVTDIDITHEPEQEQRKDDMTAAPSDPTFSEVNEEEVVESEEDEHSEDTKGLFSPITGFGWESYMTTRLDSELIRAASSEQDLALLTIRKMVVLQA